MRKNILSALIGAAIVISIAAGTANLMTVKPAMPSKVVVFNGGYNAASQFILKRANEGYILKSSVVINAGHSQEEFSVLQVVMEKY